MFHLLEVILIKVDFDSRGDVHVIIGVGVDRIAGLLHQEKGPLVVLLEAPRIVGVQQPQLGAQALLV